MAKVLSVRVSDEEHDQLLAEAGDQVFSKYVRSKLLSSPIVQSTAAAQPAIAKTTADVKKQLATVVPYVRKHHPRCPCLLCQKKAA